MLYCSQNDEVLQLGKEKEKLRKSLKDLFNKEALNSTIPAKMPENKKFSSFLGIKEHPQRLLVPCQP